MNTQRADPRTPRAGPFGRYFFARRAVVEGNPFANPHEPVTTFPSWAWTRATGPVCV